MIGSMMLDAVQYDEDQYERVLAALTPLREDVIERSTRRQADSARQFGAAFAVPFYGLDGQEMRPGRDEN